MDKRLTPALLVMLVTYFLFIRNPRCSHGCRSVAEHVFYYGLDDILGALLG